MVTFLRSIDYDVWDCVEDGYSRPTMVTCVKSLLKPKARWNQGEKHIANCNNKAIDAIYNGVTPLEFRLISTCSSAKDAWDILQTMHEGTYTVKPDQNPKYDYCVGKPANEGIINL